MSNTTPVEERTETSSNTYGQILSSSALIGSSSLINILIGTLRTKAMAILLGPGGFGLFGLYGSIASLSQCIAGMGIYSSGVRQIAHAAAADDASQIARTTTVLRRTCIVLGILGAILLAIFSRPVSTLTFGTPNHAGAVLLLSIAVFLHLLSDGQSAIIHGMRRIGDLARMNVFGTFFGTVISISLVYFFRDRGVVPSLVAVALVTLAASWWYSRKLHAPAPTITATQITHEASSLLKLGFAFMTSGLMSLGTAYAVRIIILRGISAEATGYYQSAWTIGCLYVRFILEAMGADFYPRLTARADDNSACNRLVNEQTLVGLLLAGPGVLATLAFAPLVIFLFYSSRFAGAVGILRWITLGTIVQVISWPMSYMIVAKGRQGLYFATEVAYGIISIPLAWLCIRTVGINGAGIAFFFSNVLYALLLVPVVRRLSGFRWSLANKKSAALFLSLISTSFAGFNLLPLTFAASLATLLAVAGAIYSLRTLVTLVPWESIPLRIRRVLTLLRFSPVAETPALACEQQS